MATLRDELIRLAKENEAGAQVIFSEDFSAVGRVHDWRSHVPHDIRPLWMKLSEETRLALYIAAKEQADSEVWD